MTYKDAVSCSTNGVLIRVHVVPGSSHSVFPAGYNQWRKCLEMRVSAEAKENQANTAVVETIASFFKTSPENVVLVSGQKSREKTVCLTNVPLEKACSALEDVFHET
jgi:uncharacterized protein (TIGR00251 family)